MKNSMFLILGNQLFNSKYINEYKKCIFFMCEDLELCSSPKHHKLKILLFLSSMRSYADKLRKEKFKLNYISLENNSDIPYILKLEKFIKKKKITEIINFEIEDKFFEKKVELLIKKNNLNWKILNSPMFLTSRNDFRDFLDKTKKPLMANFYKISRRKHNILIENNKPKGGKWSFDEENRKKLPKDIYIPSSLIAKVTPHTKELKPFIKINFKKNPGNVEDFWFPTTRDESLKFLENFLKYKINNFGDYEDAVSKRSNTLFHSALSPLINIGLITPEEILNKIKKIEDKVKINSLEGYVRQIIGWREFMRGIYQNFDKTLEKENFFNHKNKMKISWYKGTTGLEPLDHSIKNALKYGWSHHIERLMILANIMNLCQIHPREVYKWFMEMFVDSSDWVMAPNVYGMGLFSDGGIFATKPYICGSSYFLKMMDFKKGEWCDVMDGLYWNFINNNRKFFSKNPRLSMMVKIFDKIKNERKKRILIAAKNFISQNTI